MIKSLITGPGFVASHLADLLLLNGEQVYVTTRWTDDKSSFDHIKDKVNWVPMDLNDFNSCIKAMEDVKPDYIYHLGAQSWVRESFVYPALTIQTNTVGTVNLLEAIKIVRDKSNNYLKQFEKIFNPVIHICSSSEVYGLVKEEDLPIKETQPFNPANPYAVGKVGADMAGLMYYTNYGLKVIRTRMFTHTGPRRVMLSAECFYAKRIAEIENEMIFSPKDEYIIKLGNMESIRTWADVRDAVRAYYQLVRQCKPGEVYNIGGNTTKTIQEVLDYLLSISKIPRDKVKLVVDPSLLRPYDVTLQVPDCSKFANETKWEQFYTFEQTMTDLLNDWRERV